MPDTVQDLGQVAADLTVDGDGLAHPDEVLAGHPLGRLVQGLGERSTDARLINDPAELSGGRFLGLLGDRLQGLQQAVPGPQAAGQ